MSKIKNCLLGSCGFESVCAQVMYFIFRVVLGFFMLYLHGWGKGLPPTEQTVGKMKALSLPLPEVMAWLLVFGEIICAALLIIGLFTRFAAITLGITMVVAAWAHLFGAFGGGLPKAELALVYLAGFGLIAALGGGKFSLDRILNIGK